VEDGKTWEDDIGVTHLKAPVKRVKYSYRKGSIFFPFRRLYRSGRINRVIPIFPFAVVPLGFVVSGLTAPVTHQDQGLQKNESSSSAPPSVLNGPENLEKRDFGVRS